MITRKITAYVHQDDLIGENLDKRKVEQGKLDVWLINPGPSYSEINLEFQQPDVIHHITDTQIQKLVKILGFDPMVGTGKKALEQIFGETTEEGDQ